MMAAIESAEGVLSAREIAKASDRLIGIALGAEDYVTNMKTRRYPEWTRVILRSWYDFTRLVLQESLQSILLLLT